MYKNYKKIIIREIEKQIIMFIFSVITNKIYKNKYKNIINKNLISFF